MKLFLLFLNSSFVKIWESATNSTFICFVFCSKVYTTQLSWHAVQGILSKTCEHIFMLIALNILNFVVSCWLNKSFDFIRTQCNPTTENTRISTIFTFFLCHCILKEVLLFCKEYNCLIWKMLYIYWNLKWNLTVSTYYNSFNVV